MTKFFKKGKKIKYSQCKKQPVSYLNNLKDKRAWNNMFSKII